MSQIIEVKVPDIGDFESVPVIELFVKVGDTIKVDDAIVTLESDKATMDVPSTVEGVVKEVLVSLGSKVGEGALLIKVETGGAAAAAAAPAAQAAAPAPAPTAAPVAAAPAAGGGVVEVKVPDIGDFAEVPVIELYVKVGDSIKVDDAIATLESDKATMDVPSTVAGTVKEVLVQIGSKVGEGTVLIKVESGSSAPAAAPQAAAPAPVAAAPAPVAAPVATAAAAPVALAPALAVGSKVHRLAVRPCLCPRTRCRSEQGAGHRPEEPHRQGRPDQVRQGRPCPAPLPARLLPLAAPASAGGLDLLPWPKVDFAKFGEIEVKPLSRIKKISGQNLSRNWVMIPAVTYHEDADITDIEAFRVLLNKENEKGGGAKLTMLAFLMKACVKGLQKFPEFNSSLDGDNLVLKKYFNIGFAADTPNGLVVPVVKNVDKKSVFELAQESGDLAKQARDGKLKPADMSGACFTISSLGGIGGTYFAPIVNAPEVAILGVNKSAMKPVWDGKAFVPRLVLPLSLTADHRVIDGALATRFNVYIAQLLADFRRVAL